MRPHQLQPLALELQPSGLQFRAAGSVVQLLCIVLNMTLAMPDTLRWTFRGDASGVDAPVTGMTERLHYLAAQLTVTDMQAMFAGEYTCRARFRPPLSGEAMARVRLRLGRECRPQPAEAPCPSSGFCLDLHRHCGGSGGGGGGDDDAGYELGLLCPDAPELCRGHRRLLTAAAAPPTDIRQTFAEFARPVWRRLVMAAGCLCVLLLTCVLIGAVWRQRRERERKSALMSAATATSGGGFEAAAAAAAAEFGEESGAAYYAAVGSRSPRPGYQRSNPCSPLAAHHHHHHRQHQHLPDSASRLYSICDPSIPQGTLGIDRQQQQLLFQQQQHQPFDYLTSCQSHRRSRSLDGGISMSSNDSSSTSSSSSSSSGSSSAVEGAVGDPLPLPPPPFAAAPAIAGAQRTRGGGGSAGGSGGSGGRIRAAREFCV